MTLADSYLQNCLECGEAYSRAESFCPYCGTPTGVEFELGIGAVLYEDRPDTPDDERRLHHVTDRRVSLEDGDVYYVIWDGTHTQRHHYHAEDVLADFAPAGWQWPTGRKPTYWLTRHCGVDDEMDLMTDGGVDQSTGGRGPNGFAYLDADRSQIGQWETGEFRMRIAREDGDLMNLNLRPEQFEAFVEAIQYVEERSADPETDRSGGGSR